MVNRFHLRNGWARAVLGLAVLACLLLAGTYFWLARDLPDPASIGERLFTPSLRITDRNGRLLYEVLPETGGRHTVVDLSTIPADLRQATIATEDSNFYQNPGVDIAGITRAAWINLRGGEALAGGSTITQQVARNLLMHADERADRNLRRKLREAVLAWNLARRLPKDEILGLYLNQMYYGNLAYGVEAASQTYFGKPASQLDLAESALLAGLTQLPAIYDPFQHPEAAKQRQEVVLGLMEKNGAISPEQRVLAAAEPLVYNQHPYPIRAPHFVMMVRAEVDGLIDPVEVYRRGGLTVRTTLDLDWQQRAEDAVHHQLQRLKDGAAQAVDYNVNDAALAALDPHSGEILAMVGSPDYFDDRISGAINMATAPRQPGSALKPLIYAAAFDPAQPAPWTPATMLLDVQTSFLTHDGKPYTPSNYDGVEHGPVLARQALASSLNIPAVLTLQHVGIQRLFSLAGSLGITTLHDPDQYDLSLALGGGEVSLLELTAVYSAFANGGMTVTPQAILDIRDQSGNILYTPPKPEQQRVLDPRVAWLITDILSDDDARELGFGRDSVLRLDRPAAVKTGTTTNFHDNWTVGYTPDLVVGVWAGNASHTAMHNINGLTGAAPIWHEFIRAALTGKPETAFTRPDGLARSEVCALSGMAPSADCPYHRLEWFIDGTQPARADTLYHRVVIDLRTGRLANSQTPANQTAARLALDLPPQAAPWARANKQLLLGDLTSAHASGSGLPGAALPGIPTNSGDPAESEGALSWNSAQFGLRILSPADRTIYHLAAGLDAESQRVRIEVAGDPGFSQVKLWIDDAMAEAFLGSPYQYWWELKKGVHTIRAEAVDPGGQVIASNTITVEVK